MKECEASILKPPSPVEGCGRISEYLGKPLHIQEQKRSDAVEIAMLPQTDSELV